MPQLNPILQYIIKQIESTLYPKIVSSYVSYGPIVISSFEFLKMKIQTKENININYLKCGEED